METLQKQTLYVCGCCKHTLPSEAFYVDKKTGLPNNYCKECRKSASRKYRKTEKRTLARDDREPYHLYERPRSSSETDSVRPADCKGKYQAEKAETL